jgi:hypothetical protein
VCLLANNARLRTLLIAVAILIVAQQAVLLLLQRMATEDPAHFWHYYTTPLMFAPFFAVGIVVYRSRSSGPTRWCSLSARNCRLTWVLAPIWLPFCSLWLP